MADQGLRVRLSQSQPIPLNVELQCHPNEVLALVGPSGSGKSTVLKTIAGIYRPENAMITCQGEIWQDSSRNYCLPAHQRAVGMVFQNYALFPHFTALGNVMAALAHLPKQERKARATELLTRVHLGGLEQRYPASLSGGQQQRVAVARALAREPRALLLDEPFSAVDQVTRRRLHRELNELRRSLSIPMILVTHDLDEAAMLADRLCLLHKGVTLQSGTPSDVVSHPASATVARLMDQQNLFAGICIGHSRHKQQTLLRWRGLTLEARFQPDYAPGQRVCWMIPSSSILLHRRNRQSKGDRENPLSGIIIEYMVLGEHASVRVEIDKQAQIAITMSVPVHVASRNELAYGQQVTISLLAEGIHLMPYTKMPGVNLDEELN